MLQVRALPSRSSIVRPYPPGGAPLRAEGPAMPFASNGEVSIYYESAGEGRPIVFIHANPFDHRLWLYQVPRYSSLFRTIVVDIRGYGRSSKPETPFSLRDMADDVLAVCRQEEIEHAIFAGVSVGSGMAMLIGLDNPELVEALILVGGSSGGSADPAPIIDGYSEHDFFPFYAQHLLNVVSPAFGASTLGRWLLDLFIADAPHLSGLSIAQNFRARNACNMKDRLPLMSRPALVINGEHDPSLHEGRISASLIPGAVHAMIPGAGHACNIEDPAAFDAAVLPFLGKLGLT
jgi:pimeloyl-ACP methyl ester carboxylesterase